MAPREILQAIAAVPMFSVLTKKQAEAVAEEMRLQRIARGQVLVREGDPGGRMYVIVQGAARVIQGGRNLRRIGAGEVVGEFSLLSGRPRAATVEALGDMEVLSMTATAFRALMEAHPRINHAVMRTFALRLHDGSRSPLR